MHNTSSDILESYIRGKDSGEYHLLEAIYDENAEVVFEIATTQISFPEKIQGNIAIARVLSKDFSKKYGNVKTYYLSAPAKDKYDIENQKWLVVMRDIQNDTTLVGSGYYNWHFFDHPEGVKITRHKIYIHCMVALTDGDMTELSRIQGELSYPWTKTSLVTEATKSNAALHEVAGYVAA